MSTRQKTPRKWKTYDDEKKERIVIQIDNDLQSDKVTIKAACKRVEINQTQYDHWQQKCIICLEFYHKVGDLFEICPAHTRIYAPCTVTQLMVKSNGTFSYPDYRNTTTLSTVDNKQKSTILKTAPSWIKTFIVSQKKEFADLMMELFELRDQDLSLEQTVIDFATFSMLTHGKKIPLRKESPKLEGKLSGPLVRVNWTQVVGW